MARPFKCAFCGSTTSVAKGYRRTKTMGKRRVRLCKACGRKFTPQSQKPIEAREARQTETEEPETASAGHDEAQAETDQMGQEGTDAEHEPAPPQEPRWTS